VHIPVGQLLFKSASSLFTHYFQSMNGSFADFSNLSPFIAHLSLDIIVQLSRMFFHFFSQMFWCTPQLSILLPGTNASASFSRILLTLAWPVSAGDQAVHILSRWFSALQMSKEVLGRNLSFEDTLTERAIAIVN
jgi:hypothetical protein